MVEKKNVLNIITASVAWLATWVCTQGLFMSGILDYLPGERNIKYALATVWVFTVLTICLAMMPAYRKASLPRSKLLWLYVVPGILLALLPGHYKMALHLPVYIFVITITVFWQDYLTFGVLQSHLATKTSATLAAILTALLFFLGHVIFFFSDIANPQFLLIVSSAFIFSFSRRYTGNIYIANLLHFCSYLI